MSRDQSEHSKWSREQVKNSNVIDHFLLGSKQFNNFGSMVFLLLGVKHAKLFYRQLEIEKSTAMIHCFISYLNPSIILNIIATFNYFHS